MFVIEGERFLEAGEAAVRLGVKPETLYAYVSRGRLRSYRRAVGRGRLYLEREVERLLTLQPPRGEAGPSADALTRDLATPAGAATPASEGEESLPPADAWAAER